jgi:hypothetical protein
MFIKGMELWGLNVLRHYKKLRNQTEVANLSTLRTGHCQLNGYLHRFNIVDTPLCDCGSGTNKSVKHYLLLYRRYNKQSQKLLRSMRCRGMHVEKLLGTSKYIKNTLEFIKCTGRLR